MKKKIRLDVFKISGEFCEECHGQRVIFIGEDIHTYRYGPLDKSEWIGGYFECLDCGNISDYGGYDITKFSNFKQKALKALLPRRNFGEAI